MWLILGTRCEESNIVQTKKAAVRARSMRQLRIPVVAVRIGAGLEGKSERVAAEEAATSKLVLTAIDRERFATASELEKTGVSLEGEDGKLECQIDERCLGWAGERKDRVGRMDTLEGSIERNVCAGPKRSDGNPA